MVYNTPTLHETDRIIFSGRYGQYTYWIHNTHLLCIVNGISPINNNALLKAYSIDRNILDNIYMLSLWCKSGGGDRPTFRTDWYPKDINKMVHTLYKYIKTIDESFEYEVVSDWWVVKFSTLNKPQQEMMQATESEPKQGVSEVCKQLEDYERITQDRLKELARLQWGHTYKLPKTKTTTIPYL